MHGRGSSFVHRERGGWALPDLLVPRNGSAFTLQQRGHDLTSDDEVGSEAEIGYDLERLDPIRVGRPSLSIAGDSPQVRFRLSASTRAEAAEVAAREGKTISQLARDAVEAYLQARRSA